MEEEESEDDDSDDDDVPDLADAGVEGAPRRTISAPLAARAAPDGGGRPRAPRRGV